MDIQTLVMIIRQMIKAQEDLAELWAEVEQGMEIQEDQKECKRSCPFPNSRHQSVGFNEHRDS